MPLFNVFGFTIESENAKNFQSVLLCRKTLFHGWNILLLEALFSSACPRGTQPFAVPMGDHGGKEQVQEKAWKVPANPGDGKQDWELKLNILGTSYISNSQLDRTACNIALVSVKQHFMVSVSSFVFFVRITEKVLQTEVSSASMTLVFFSFCRNYALVKGKPSAFVHCRSNLAKLHS